MPYFAANATRDNDAAVRRAGNAAMGLWLRAGAWSVARMTDGHVPGEVAADLGTEPQARKLVAAGLWAETADGYVFTTWAEDGNRTRAEVQHVSDARAAAGRAGGKASGKSRRNDPENDVISGANDPENDVTSGASGVEMTRNSGGVTPSDQGKSQAGASSKSNPLPSPTLPYPTDPPTGSPRGGTRVDLPSGLQAVVDAWAEGASAAPVRPELKRITGDARELLASGTPLDDVCAGARIAGGEGRPTIRVSVRKHQARRRGPAELPVNDNIRGWMDLHDQLGGQGDGQVVNGQLSDATVVELPRAAGGEG